MPHFEVKLYPGYRPEQLQVLTDHIVQAAVHQASNLSVMSP